MEFLIEYGMFLAKAVTLVFCVLLVLGNILPFGRNPEDDEKGVLRIVRLNDRFEARMDDISAVVLDKKQMKDRKKKAKQEAKEKKKQDKKAAANPASDTVAMDSATDQPPTAAAYDAGAEDQTSDSETPVEDGDTAIAETKIDENTETESGRLFALSFNGDVQARAAGALREEISAILGIAEDNDEVLVNIESAGGVVHGYGYAASQLDRIRKHGLKLTVAVDKVAASGGYMMACVADRILAAPFAIIGSIGVVAQLPNFHRLMEDNKVDFELHTAGKYKRTLTMFGENTDEEREKFREDLEDVHGLFKDFVADHRPGLDVDSVATGEIWFGTRALEIGLVDEVCTSDEYLFSRIRDQQIFEVKYEPKKSLQERLTQGAESAISGTLVELFNRLRTSRFFS